MHNIKTLINDNEELKRLDKEQKKLSVRVDLTSDESGDESAVNTEESLYLPTQQLAQSLNTIKDKRKVTAQQTDA